MTPGDPEYRKAVRADLLRFAAGSRHEHGFGYLDVGGAIDADRAVELYLTCRMTHVFSLGLLAGEEPAAGGPDAEHLRELVDHGVVALLEGPLHDVERGGWFASVHPDGSVDDAKQAYAHAFVVLAASSAVVAGAARAPELLDLALRVQSDHFWDEQAGLVVEQWNAEWSELDDYRGVNSNMHTVEGYLAAGDVTGDATWHARAARIAGRVAEWARGNQWRIPEHFTPDWQPMLEHNRDQPAHPFQPYGATVGHGLEWARLLVAVSETFAGAADADALKQAALALTDRAVADGWAADGADGFVYTTDWDGNPVVRERMHWVLTEAIATSTVLARVAGEDPHARDLARWWDYADAHLIDHEHGSWHHELGTDNQPSATTWPGKPDAYHAYQAALIADVPTTPSFASALAARA
ncbi:AGE family epimerase/isomerase [Tessaracoccus sp. OS52]|uniref:AGE family epimerase/isomerase n=1 Tax=Tessaracoccus sp. OS52 TaxID=2886691 RepID=UPI001D100E1C|nr:AGE family epimerase/isomerase [Tessaracoccus sp. OS52]MCC2593915.1 AGE family epimerase/isomerase [Tessaracoccus sp. OS52]